MSRKSKTKGSEYERRIAKMLSDWSGLKIFRTPLSGGYRLSTKSDLTTKNPDDFVMIVDTKKWENSYSLKSLLDNNLDVFIDVYWKKLKETKETCVVDNKRYYKFPIMIFSSNYDDDYCVISYAFFKRMKTYSFPFLKKKDYVIMKFKYFLDYYTYNHIKMFVREGGAI